MQLLIQHSNFYRKYYLLFKSLNLSSVYNKNYSIGRTGYSRHAMIRSFIVKHLERIKSVPVLIDFLDARPALTHTRGFKPGVIPDESQFYRFLSDTNNSALKNIHHSINKKLIDKNIISMNHFIVDSKPVLAATKENNFKNPNRDTRDKNKKIKRNPKATLSYYCYQSINGQKDNFTFFWGYRVHVIVSKEGIPLIKFTPPNNFTDAKAAQKNINKLKRVYGLNKNSFFLADAAYDVKKLYNFIVAQLKCNPFIPINPRDQRNNHLFSPNGLPLCDAGFEMKLNGKCYEPHRTRLRFRCPFKMNISFAKQHPKGCPVYHKKSTGYGCTKYLDITNDARANVPRDSKLYKDVFNLRVKLNVTSPDLVIVKLNKPHSL